MWFPALISYPVLGCWAADRPTADFKRLAAAQHPEALGDPAGWAVLLPGADATLDTLDLAAVVVMLARGELSLAGPPWLLVWKDGDAADGVGADGGDGEVVDGGGGVS